MLLDAWLIAAMVCARTGPSKVIDCCDGILRAAVSLAPAFKTLLQAITVAYIGGAMVTRNKRHGWQVITVVVLLFALLITLLPHPDHLSVAMTYPLLVMVFLFGAIDVPFSLWHMSLLSEPYSPQSPDLPSRFQRPPPAL
jgi:hypothetical protein